MRPIVALALVAGIVFACLPAAAQQNHNPNSGGCAVTSTDAVCISNGAFRSDLFLENNSFVTNVACAFGSTAALYTGSSFMLYPGQSRRYSLAAGTPPPIGDLHCIGSSTGSIRYEGY